MLRALGVLDQAVEAIDPLSSDIGRLRAGSLAKRRATTTTIEVFADQRGRAQLVGQAHFTEGNRGEVSTTFVYDPDYLAGGGMNIDPALLPASGRSTSAGCCARSRTARRTAGAVASSAGPSAPRNAATASSNA